MNYSNSIETGNSRADCNTRFPNLPAFCVLITALLLAIVANVAQALEFQCELPGDVRYLKVDIPGTEKLCEVSVKYEHNGETKILWHAQNDTMFCSARAYELKDKYEDTWQYTCKSTPDRDGIDKLSPSQRAILDKQLKSFIDFGRNSETPFEVTGVKAVASTPLDNTAGLLAFQYFVDSDTDYTEIIQVNGESWKLMTILQSLEKHIDSDTPLSSALIQTISDTGVLEIHTTLANSSSQVDCFGAQVFSISTEGDISEKSPHHYVCHEALTERAG